MEKFTSDVMKAYLNDSKAFQNYLIGFSVVQSISFLYGLEKFLDRIYTFHILISLGIIITCLINICILFFTSSYEISIIKQCWVDTNQQTQQFIIKLIEKAKWFRIFLVGFIGLTTLTVFIIIVLNYKI